MEDCFVFGLILGSIAMIPVGIVTHIIWRVLTASGNEKE